MDISTGSQGGQDHALKGVLFAFASFAAFSFSDASVKLVHGALPTYESAFFGAVFALLVLPFLRAPGEPWHDVVATTNRPLWLLRFIAYPLGVGGSVMAFTHLTMAEAFTLIFLQPAFVTIMSATFLKERIFWQRKLAVLLGFIGVLIVLRPGLRPLSIGHVGAIIAGLGGAIQVISFRAAGPNESRLSLFGAGILGALALCGLASIPTFKVPTLTEMLFLSGYGLLAAFANVLLMRAAQLAPAGQISPTQYSQMLWAIVIGYIIFSDTIDLPTIAGIALIVASGLITLLRERTTGAALPPAVGRPGPAASSLLPDDPIEQDKAA